MFFFVDPETFGAWGIARVAILCGKMVVPYRCLSVRLIFSRFESLACSTTISICKYSPPHSRPRHHKLIFSLSSSCSIVSSWRAHWFSTAAAAAAANAHAEVGKVCMPFFLRFLSLFILEKCFDNGWHLSWFFFFLVRSFESGSGITKWNVLLQMKPHAHTSRLCMTHTILFEVNMYHLLLCAWCLFTNVNVRWTFGPSSLLFLYQTLSGDGMHIKCSEKSLEGILNIGDRVPSEN